LIHKLFAYITITPTVITEHPVTEFAYRAQTESRYID